VILLPADLADPTRSLPRRLRRRPDERHLRPAAPRRPDPQLGVRWRRQAWKVERALKAAGCELVDFAPFADHLAYDEATLHPLAERATLLARSGHHREGLGAVACRLAGRSPPGR